MFTDFIVAASFLVHEAAWLPHDVAAATDAKLLFAFAVLAQRKETVFQRKGKESGGGAFHIDSWFGAYAICEIEQVVKTQLFKELQRIFTICVFLTGVGVMAGIPLSGHAR